MKPNRCKRTQATRCSIPVRTQSLKPGTSKTKSRPWALQKTLCHACTEIILVHEVQFKEESSATGPQARQLLCTTFSQDNVLVPTAQAGRSQPHVVTNNTALTNPYTHPPTTKITRLQIGPNRGARSGARLMTYYLLLITCSWDGLAWAMGITLA